MSVETPVLTAILIVANQRERARRSLQSLLNQSLIEKMEVLLVDCSRDGTPPVPGSDHPSVCLLRLSPGLAAGWVRAEAIRQAKAPLVVFLEEHARACPGWAEAIVEALAGPWAGVGPELANGNPEFGISTYVELMYYPVWSSPAEGGASPAAPLHNSAYKRDLLLSYGPQLEALMFPETLLQRRLGRDGYRLLVEPKMKVSHYYETELGLIASGDFQAHRAFGALFPQMSQRPLWRRVLRLLALPVIPWWRTAKLWWIVGRKRPARLGLVLRGIGVILALHHAAASGEFVGTVFGLGQSPERYLDYQLNIPRDIPAA